MKTASLDLEFAPLDVEQAKELEEIINSAAREKKAVVIDPEDEGITGSVAKEELISPADKTNGLARYQRHY